MHTLGSFRGLTLLAPASSKSRIVPFARTLLLPARAPLLRSINTFPANTRDHSNRATARDPDLRHALNDASRRLIPPLTSESNMGSQGKMCRGGACMKFTGAPYLAAISSLKVGADLAYVLCMEIAPLVMTTYIPEFIMLPYLPQADNMKEAILRINPSLGRATIVVVVGPEPGGTTPPSTKRRSSTWRRRAPPSRYSCLTAVASTSSPSTPSAFAAT